MAQSDLYKFLEENKNTFFTSYELSKIFKVNQTSISRNIARLRKAKFKIDAIKKSSSVHDFIYGINNMRIPKNKIIELYKSKSLNTMELN